MDDAVLENLDKLFRQRVLALSASEQLIHENSAFETMMADAPKSLTDEGCDFAIWARNAKMVDEAVEALATALGGIDILVPNVTGNTASGEVGWRSNRHQSRLTT